MLTITPPPYRPEFFDRTNLQSPPAITRMITRHDNEIENIADILLGRSSPIRRIDFDLEPKKEVEVHLTPCEDNCECSICFESDVISENGGALPCKHTFHKECIKQWFKMKNTCPYCRTNID